MLQTTAGCRDYLHQTELLPPYCTQVRYSGMHYYISRVLEQAYDRFWHECCRLSFINDPSRVTFEFIIPRFGREHTNLSANQVCNIVKNVNTNITEILLFTYYVTYVILLSMCIILFLKSISLIV